MLTRRLLLTSTIFFTLFILQESLFSQIRLPLGGFSLFLIFTICWSALSTPEVGAITGFGAGLLLDLAPANDGPIGQWTLVLIVIGYGIAFLRYGDDSLRGNPFSLVVLVAVGVVVTLGIYLITGALLGLDLGTGFQLMKILVGNGIWTLVVAPFLLPLISRLHRAIFETRETL
ncbi:MAG: rod shape-determining protein MreD [Actinomycetes bacterium]|jgi:hypothetical protein